MHKHKNQPLGARILLMLAVAVFVFTASVRPAASTVPVVTVEDVPRKTESIFSRIKKVVGSIAFHQAVRFVTFKLANDTAKWLASGEKGKKPLVFQQGWKGAVTDI